MEEGSGQPVEAQSVEAAACSALFPTMAQVLRAPKRGGSAAVAAAAMTAAARPFSRRGGPFPRHLCRVAAVVDGRPVAVMRPAPVGPPARLPATFGRPGEPEAGRWAPPGRGLFRLSPVAVRTRAMPASVVVPGRGGRLPRGGGEGAFRRSGGAGKGHAAATAASAAAVAGAGDTRHTTSVREVLAAEAAAAVADAADAAAPSPGGGAGEAGRAPASDGASGGGRNGGVAEVPAAAAGDAAPPPPPLTENGGSSSCCGFFCGPVH